MTAKTLTFLITLLLLMPGLASRAPAALPVTNGLTLHLDAESLNLADGAAVSSWPAVVGPDATQSNSSYQPIYRAHAIPNVVNDRPAVDFDQADDHMDLTAILADSATALVVAKWKALGQQQFYVAGNPNHRMGHRNGKQFVGEDLNGYAFSDTTDYHIHTYIALDDMYLDGVAMGTTPWSTGGGILSGIDRIGCEVSATGGGLDNGGPAALIAGIVLYDRALNESERILVEQYLYDKYFGTLTEEYDPPTPDPMTWSVGPCAIAGSSITMTATTAIDALSPPVWYYFECTTDNNFSSGWQADPTYDAMGLLPQTAYTFRVKARDSAPSQNETGWSDPGSATTMADQSAVVPVDDLSSLRALSSPSNLEVVFMAHRTQPDDRGGGLFAWDSQCSLTDDGALIIEPNDHVGNGRWRRIFSGGVKPSWYGVIGDGVNDDTAALQACIDSGFTIELDQDCYVTTVEFGGINKTIDFNGHRIIGNADTATQAVFQITGRYLNLTNVWIDGNHNPNYSYAVRWHSAIGAPAQFNKIFGLTIENSLGGLLYGSPIDDAGAQAIPQSENYIYGMQTRAVHHCLDLHQPSGVLFLIGGALDCNQYDWDTAFDPDTSYAIYNQKTLLFLTDLELNRTDSSNGFLVAGSASMTSCRIQSTASLFYFDSHTDGNDLFLTDCTGHLDHDSSSIIEIRDKDCNLRLRGCTFSRPTGVGSYSTAGLCQISPGHSIDLKMTDCENIEWLEDYIAVGGSGHQIRILNSKFGTGTTYHTVTHRFATDSQILTGSGSPEGIITAPPGSLYFNSAGGTNTSLYIKESGTGNTGWRGK